MEETKYHQVTNLHTYHYLEIVANYLNVTVCHTSLPDCDHESRLLFLFNQMPNIFN